MINIRNNLLDNLLYALNQRKQGMDTSIKHDIYSTSFTRTNSVEIANDESSCSFVKLQCDCSNTNIRVKCAFLLITSQESQTVRNNVLMQTKPVTRFGIKTDIMKTASQAPMGTALKHSNMLLLEELFKFSRVHHLSFLFGSPVCPINQAIRQTGGSEIMSEP